MSLVLLLVNTLGLLLGTGVGQITPPARDTWADYTSQPLVGDGTSGSPFIVTSAQELAYAAKNVSFCFIELQNDIDLAGHEWIPMIISVFNGNGHTISNMKMNLPEGNAGFVSGGAAIVTIKDVNFTNVNLFGKNAATVNPANLMGNFQNIIVKSGRIVAKETAAGISINHSLGSFSNCINNAEVISLNGNAGGIVGSYNSAVPSQSISNCINTGSVTALNSAGGIAGTLSNGQLKNCLSEGTITGSTVGGICGTGIGTIESCGFNGNLKLQGESSILGAGSITGGFGHVGTLTPVLNVVNCYGIADINIGDKDPSVVAKFGAGRKYLYMNVNFGEKDPNYTSTYSYSNIVSSSGIIEQRKYKTGTEETEPFTDFAYHKNINGGFPFPKTLFAVGQFIDSDVMGYLEEYGFSTPPVIKNDGTHYYVELGEYPQTYVGDSLNATLKSWYTSNNPSSVDSYTNDKGTSADTITHYAYSYNGNKYVRVVSAILNSSSGYITQDESTTLMPNQEYWFKVEPIKWWVLNYTDVQNGANPIVLAEQALTANVTWNKSQSDQNLWASKSNIRTWLNESFYNDAFKVGYADYIQTTIVKNNSSSSNTDGSGTTTNDNVWLLSYGEAGGGTAGQYSENRYFNDSPSRLCSPTDYALVNKCFMYVNASYPTEIRKNGGSCPWWLRSAYASNTYNAQFVGTNGSLNNNSVFTYNSAVRPALTLNL